jgi:dienelactone hydrolase
MKFDVGGKPYAIDKNTDTRVTGKRPVVVVVHGVDGMGGASGIEIGKFAVQLAGEGFLVFTPHYFDAADGPDTAPLEAMLALRVPRVASYPPRIAAAIDFALTQPDADADRLGLIGLSLGGGLALGYAVSAPAGHVKALVDFFGHIADPGILANVNRLPPTLILHNLKDEVVKVVVSSQPLMEALGKTAVTHDHKFYSEDHLARKHHPFLPGGFPDTDSRARSVAWLKTYL